MHKMWSIRIMQYYSFMKGDETLTQYGTHDILLSERGRTQRLTHCVIPFL